MMGKRVMQKSGSIDLTENVPSCQKLGPLQKSLCSISITGKINQHILRAIETYRRLVLFS